MEDNRDVLSMPPGIAAVTLRKNGSMKFSSSSARSTMSDGPAQTKKKSSFFRRSHG